LTKEKGAFSWKGLYSLACRRFASDICAMIQGKERATVAHKLFTARLCLSIFFNQLMQL
jgi:hypothetical protein